MEDNGEGTIMNFNILLLFKSIKIKVGVLVSIHMIDVFIYIC